MAAQLNEPPALDAEPPKPVQRWTASDYAKNGRFVQELAGPIFHLLSAKPGERILCFIPESGRFTVAYLLLEVMEPAAQAAISQGEAATLAPPPTSTARPATAPRQPSGWVRRRRF